MARVGTAWLLVAVLIAGCGGGEAETINYRDTPAYPRKTEELKQQRAEERQINKEVRELEQGGPKEKTPTGPDPEPNPEAAPSPNSLVAKVRKEASEFCSIFPQAKMAREYGVSNDLGAVARAYASEYRPGLQRVAEAGCVEGLSS